MDLIDRKFEKLKDQVYKLGIKPVQFRNMVENHALIEWSPEVALAMGTRFMSWVVEEDENEYVDDEDGKSAVPRKNSSFNSLQLMMGEGSNEGEKVRKPSQNAINELTLSGENPTKVKRQQSGSGGEDEIIGQGYLAIEKKV